MNQIIQVLCSSIHPEKVFIEFANILGNITDLEFVQSMIETLTLTLAASPLYSNLRNKLIGKFPPEFIDSKEKLFLTLY